MNAREALEPHLDLIEGWALDDEFVMAILREARAALDSSPKGTMRAWMAAHDGELVTTVQVDRKAGTRWAPTGRTVEARPSFVLLSGSRRDYKGMRVLHATENALIVADDWHVVAYVAEEVAR